MNWDSLQQQQEEYARRAREAQSKAAQAYARLLDVAETDAGQAKRVREFLAASFDGEQHQFNLFSLRALDAAISDDILLVIDAIRWAQTDVYNLVPNGYVRVVAILERYGIGKGFLVQPDR